MLGRGRGRCARKSCERPCGHIPGHVDVGSATKDPLACRSMRTGVGYKGLDRPCYVPRTEGPSKVVEHTKMADGGFGRVWHVGREKKSSKDISWVHPGGKAHRPLQNPGYSRVRVPRTFQGCSANLSVPSTSPILTKTLPKIKDPFFRRLSGPSQDHGWVCP